MSQFDPNKFDPNKGIHQTNLNNQKGGKKQEAATEQAADATSTGDPYAELKMDPSQLMSLLSAQAKYNLHNSQIEHTPIQKSVLAFTDAISPEAHSKLSARISKAYTEEFGKPPSAEVLQNAIDDYLIGVPVVEV